MKKCGNASTQTASEPMNEPADAINSSPIDSMNSDVLRNEDLNFQPFSMRGYMADVRNSNPMSCIPFNDNNENISEQQGSLDVPPYRWWRCTACVREVAPSSVAAHKRSNELADSIKSFSIDSTTSDVNCQRFSMRGYVAEKRIADPKVCIPLDGISENRWEQLRGSLDVPHFRWWRCRSCVRELVTSSTTAQDSSQELRVDGGSLNKNNTKPPAKDINMVDSIGEREIPFTVSLELLAAAAAAEMTSDQLQLLETSQASNAEKESLFEQKTSGFGNDAIIEEGDEALIVFTDVIDSEDERENKKTRPMKELIWVEEKTSAGKRVTTHTLQRTEERPSSSKGQEFVRAQGSRKAKRSYPSLLPDTNPISSKHAKASGSFSQPRLSRKSNDQK